MAEAQGRTSGKYVKSSDPITEAPHHGIFSLAVFAWIEPLIKRGAEGNAFSMGEGRTYVPKTRRAEPLYDAFKKAWEKEESNKSKPPETLLMRTFWRLHKLTLITQVGILSVMLVLSLLGPYLIRMYLSWLEGLDTDPGQLKGWLLVGAILLQSFSLVFIQVQFYWTGMRLALSTKTQVILAVHDKMLRLTSSAVVDFSTGKVVNLISNDVARLDETCILWAYLFGGPAALLAVFVLLAFELGVYPALAGSAALVVILPFQSWLAKYIHKLRMRSTTMTDERVRLTGEVIGGALAMKMHCWEYRLAEQLKQLRAKEVYHKGRTAQIKAMNSALVFMLTPLITLVTFSVIMATGSTLDLSSVFYALALLGLPKLWVAAFFLQAVEKVAELHVAFIRICNFLSLEESDAAVLVGPSEATRLQVNDAEAPMMISIANASFSWENWSGKPQAMDRTIVPVAGTPETAAALDGKQMNSTLCDITLAIQKGELVGICGEVGCGKSSLLMTLLGELQALDGLGAPQIAAKSVSYCAQLPWVMGDTLQNNILFGKDMDPDKYQELLDACALMTDIEQLPAGDETELGERGVNLSGGQKARVALARAAYSGAELALLDDPLSAVDARVGRHIFQKCLSSHGVMKGTTRLLVTHQKQFLPFCDRIMVLRKGRIVADGPWSKLRDLDLVELEGVNGAASVSLDEIEADVPSGDLGQPLTTSISDTGVQDNNEDLIDEAGDGSANQDPDGDGVDGCVKSAKLAATFSMAVERGISAGSNTDFAALRAGPSSSFSLTRMYSSFWRGGPSGNAAAAHQQSGTPKSLRRMISHLVRGAEAKPVSSSEPEAKSAKIGALVKEEARETGRVSLAVYAKYIKFAGLVATAFTAAAMVVGAALLFYTQYWLGLWGAATAEEQVRAIWLQVLGILTASIVVIGVSRSSVFFERTLAAATNLHNKTIINVLRAPLRFFHVNPSGRVLNRFSRDLGVIDDLLPLVMFDTIQLGSNIVGAFVLAMIAAWPVVFVIFPLVAIFIWLRRRYITTGREIKRLEAISRSPVYSSFSAMLKGLTTVRAYGVQTFFQASFCNFQDLNMSWFFCFFATSRWLAFRLDMISATTFVGVAIAATLLRNNVSLALLGVALSNTLELSNFLQWTVRQSAETENNMTSCERLIEYSEIEREPPTVAEGAQDAPKGWPHSPSAADVVFSNVTAAYSASLPPVLKSVSFTIPAGSSCGIVGRTGSGKSSLMLSLFRLIDNTGGTISIGGVDVASIGVDALRRQLAVIPQDPVLFSGTLRGNLDPWGNHLDQQLWEVLYMVRLQDEVKTMGGLDASISEGGENLSVGQRQLLCLARALLQDATILALDEATANVDRDTDAAIQRAIRTCLGSRKSFDTAAQSSRTVVRRTLLVIAHRIDTIMDCDQLLVLSHGHLVECGSPGKLVANNGGVFAGLVAAAAAGGMQAR